MMSCTCANSELHWVSWKVIDNKGVYMNGKLTATTMTLGNVFNPPGFGVCKINPMYPKPCAPAVTQWTEFYDGMTVNGKSNPLTDSSKGTCATGCPNCITFQMTGQIPIPGLAQMKQAASAHQNDINPMGMAEALDENAKDDTPIIKRVYWKNEDGVEDNIFQMNNSVKICAELENVADGGSISFQLKNDSDKEVTVTGVVASNFVEVDISNIFKSLR